MQSRIAHKGGLSLREHAAVVCGRALTEEDEAQHLARLRSQLSLSEAAVLYRRAKTVALSSRVALCSSGDDRPIELKDIQTRADWTHAR